MPRVSGKSVFHSQKLISKKIQRRGRTENPYAKRSTGLQGTGFAEKGNEG